MISYQLLNLSKILSGLSYPGRIVILDKVDSTNQYLIDNIVNLQSGVVCLAEYQTHGRGRYGRFWYSPFGSNLYLSIYWSFLNCCSESLFVLSLVVTLVLCEVLESLGIHGVQIKWPNDVFYKGRKLAGVLVEIISTFSERIGVVIGVGINITTQLGFLNSDYRMISLEDMGFSINRDLLAIELINALYRSLRNFEYFGFFPFFSRWLALDNLYGKSVKLFFKNYVILGTYRGINCNGLLLLERSGFMYSYSYLEQISFRF